MPLLLANDTIKLYFHDNSVNNAHTALLYLEGKDIHEPKLTFEQLNIDFLKHPKKITHILHLFPLIIILNPKHTE
jgi:hypothetical protein